MSEFPNGLIEEAAALAIKKGASVENGLAMSQAISLKRIADGLWGTGGSTAGILELLNPLQVQNHH